jgi:hypothetical protein
MLALAQTFHIDLFNGDTVVNTRNYDLVDFYNS